MLCQGCLTSLLYKTVLGEENVFDGLEQESTTVVLPWGEVIELHQSFIVDLNRVDPIAPISQFNRSTKVVVGERDDIVTPQPFYGESYITNHEGRRELVVIDGDHVFDVVAGDGAPALEEAIVESLDWLQETLGRRR